MCIMIYVLKDRTANQEDKNTDKSLYKKFFLEFPTEYQMAHQCSDKRTDSTTRSYRYWYIIKCQWNQITNNTTYEINT